MAGFLPLLGFGFDGLTLAKPLRPVTGHASTPTIVK
jgi:hypothetical protein